MSWENLFMSYANNKGADQPVHLHSLISTFLVHCLDSKISLLSFFAISWLSLVCVAEQAGLNVSCCKRLKTGFLVTWFISWMKCSVRSSTSLNILNRRFILQIKTLDILMLHIWSSQNIIWWLDRNDCFEYKFYHSSLIILSLACSNMKATRVSFW